MKKLQPRALLVGALALLVACGDGTLQPPIYVPLPLHQTGAGVDVEIAIREVDIYAFELSYPFKEGDHADRKRVRALAGASTQVEPGRWVEPGTPVTLALTIDRITPDSRQRIFEQSVFNPKESSLGAKRLNARIANVQLAPGRFHVRLVVLKSEPQLRGLKADFRIVEAYLGK